MYGVGSIINAKNIIFKTNGKQNRKRLDHAYKGGRPCLVICETTDKIYFLPISGYREKEFANKIRLSANISNKPSGVNIGDIICKDVAYYKELNFLDERELYDILIKFVNYQENIKKDEFYDSIAENIKAKIEELRLILNEKKSNKVRSIKSKKNG